MNPVAAEVEVDDPAWTAVVPGAETLVEQAVHAALTSASPGLVGADVTVMLTDDETVRDLNARFRGKDQPTNVLSFPAPQSAHPHLGDIALAFGVCAAEAAAQGKTLAHHLMHLTVHGVLHLLGYDHEANDEAEAMEAMERAILNPLGVADPYAQGPDAQP